MPDRAPLLSPAALELLLSAIETREAVISGTALSDHFGSMSERLVDTGLLKPCGHETATVSLADHDDVPVTLTWSPDGGGLGYFSPTAGWVRVSDDRLVRYRVDFPVMFARMMVQADVSSRAGPVPLVPDLLWEIGDVRLGRRTQRVSVWFGRRLHDPSVWRRVGDTVEARPSSRLRILLTSTPSQRLPQQLLPGHLVVGLRDVIDFETGLSVHPDILTSRLDGSHRPAVKEALYLSPDGRRLIINGDVTIDFRSDIQIAIIRKLVEGFRTGTRYRAQELLAEAQSGVDGLRRAFGTKKWAQLEPYLASHNGLWGFEL